MVGRRCRACAGPPSLLRPSLSTHLEVERDLDGDGLCGREGNRVDRLRARARALAPHALARAPRTSLLPKLSNIVRPMGGDFQPQEPYVAAYWGGGAGGRGGRVGGRDTRAARRPPRPRPARRVSALPPSPPLKHTHKYS